MHRSQGRVPEHRTFDARHCLQLMDVNTFHFCQTLGSRINTYARMRREWRDCAVASFFSTGSIAQKVESSKQSVVNLSSRGGWLSGNPIEPTSYNVL